MIIQALIWRNQRSSWFDQETAAQGCCLIQVLRVLVLVGQAVMTRLVRSIPPVAPAYTAGGSLPLSALVRLVELSDATDCSTGRVKLVHQMR